MYAYTQEGQKSKIYPIYFVSLQMPGDELDINLEPNKSRVLLKNQVWYNYIFFPVQEPIL